MLTDMIDSPIHHPQDFYGRSMEVARFFEIIGGTQPQSVSVLGLRQSGKTSFLQYVSHQEVMSRYIPTPRDYVMIYIDMSLCHTSTDFYKQLMVRLETVLNDIQPFNLWKMPEEQINLYDIETVLCQYPHFRFILLLDEFDRICEGVFGEDFLIELRAMTGVLDYELAIVTASYRDLYWLGTHIGLPPTSPFYNIFYPTPIYLCGFSDQEAKSLIQQSGSGVVNTFSTTEVSDIYSLSGSLPFIIQATTAHWFNEKHANKQPNVSTVLDELVSELSPYFEHWWTSLDPCEQWLLLTVAKNDLQKIIPCSEIALSEARRKLLAYGLLVPDGEELAINGMIWSRWIQNHGVVDIKANPVKPVNVVKLRQKLSDSFNLEELRNLCFDLQLNYDDLPGEKRGDKIRELVIAMQARSGGLETLKTAIQCERGDIV